MSDPRDDAEAAIFDELDLDDDSDFDDNPEFDRGDEGFDEDDAEA